MICGLLTLPRLKPGDASGDARPTGPRYHLRGLPGPTFLLPQPQDVPGGVLVAVQHQPTALTDMGPHAERLLDALRARGPIGEHTRAVLAGERRRHGYGLLPSVCSFENKDAQERCPCCIRDALGEVVVLEQVGRLQVFVIEGVVALDERHGFLVVEVVALAPRLLVR